MTVAWIVIGLIAIAMIICLVIGLTALGALLGAMMDISTDD